MFTTNHAQVLILQPTKGTVLFTKSTIGIKETKERFVLMGKQTKCSFELAWAKMSCQFSARFHARF